MRLFVTGASGFLGRHVLRAARGRHEVVGAGLRRRPGTGLVALDVGEREAVLRAVAEARPDAILHLAAMANVDACEGDPQAARRVNAEGTRHVVEAARGAGAWLLAISSDLVFDGARAWYREEDPPRAVSTYAATKIEAEALALAYERSSVVRPGIIYGWGATGGRPGFCQWVLDSARNGRPVPLYTDQFRTPVYALDLARALLELAERQFVGLWHLGGPRRLSRYEFGLAMSRALDFSPELLTPVSLAGANPGAARGLDCSLASDKARGALRTPLRDVDDALAEMARGPEPLGGYAASPAGGSRAKRRNAVSAMDRRLSRR